MSKFRARRFSQSIRGELREHRIRVINIYPRQRTLRFGRCGGDWPARENDSAEEVASAVAYALSRPDNVAVEKHHPLKCKLESVTA